jgi:hypothetical protein
MQVYGDDGEFIPDAKLVFSIDAVPPVFVNQHLLVDNETIEIKAFPAANYIFEIHDPFWISDTDVIYLNDQFSYTETLLRWAAIVSGHADIPPKIFPISVSTLVGLGCKLPPGTVRAFQEGRAIWRRSAHSARAGKGENAANSAMSSRLHHSLHAWLRWAELLSRRAMQLDRDREGSPFERMDNNDLSALSARVMGHALGYREGAGEYRAETPNERNDELYPIVAPDLGAGRLHLNSFRYRSAIKEDESQKYFQNQFGLKVGGLNKLLSCELRHFRANARAFGEAYDPVALVEWAGKILIMTRVALAASLQSDSERADLKLDLLGWNDEDERLTVVNRFIVAQCRGIAADGENRNELNPGLHQILDLQWTAFLAFATDIDPIVLNPALYHGIRCRRTGEELVPPLLHAARWLGRFFRGRYMQMYLQDAAVLSGFADPEHPPGGIAEEDLQDWHMATRMLTSFMTIEGRTSLFEGAHAVLEDGQPRSVFAFTPAYWRPADVDAEQPALLERLRALGSNDDLTLRLPAPIVVEAGHLVLPGDYMTDWYHRSDPFEEEDGVQLERHQDRRDPH